jgi:glucokinase
LKQDLGENPSYERVVSGLGLKNLFHFSLELNESFKKVEEIQEVLESDDIPAEIAKRSFDHPFFKDIMRRFIGNYGHYAGNMASVFLPFSGIYIAGGIASKNLRWFTESNAFLDEFHRNDLESFREMLESLPIYIVKDYNTSLLGAAKAASVFWADSQE